MATSNRPDMDGEQGRHPSLDEHFDPAVRIVPYDPGWRNVFERERRSIRDALGDSVVSIEHVGSTAVPGMPAKPIIDIQVSVRRLEPRVRYVRRLEILGYLFAPDPDSPDYHFFAKPVERPRRFDVHVCAAGSKHERRHLAVRDFLHSRADEAHAYAELKRELARRHPNDRLGYIGEKDPYVEQLERRALEWRQAPDPS